MLGEVSGIEYPSSIISRSSVQNRRWPSGSARVRAQGRSTSHDGGRRLFVCKLLFRFAVGQEYENNSYNGYSAQDSAYPFPIICTEACQRLPAPFEPASERNVLPADQRNGSLRLVGHQENDL